MTDRSTMPLHARPLLITGSERIRKPFHSIRGTLSAPQMSGGAEAYRSWFNEWAGSYVAAANGKYAHTGVKRFDLATFDGCTVYPDICLPCCLEHDVLYHYFKRDEAARRQADDLLRECALRFGIVEQGSARHFWFLQAWAMWAAVRVLGHPVFHRVFFRDDQGEGEILYIDGLSPSGEGVYRLPMPPNPRIGD